MTEPESQATTATERALSTAPEKPRVWTVYVCFLAGLFGVIASSVAGMLAIRAGGGLTNGRPTPLGLALILGLTAVSIASVAVCAGKLSPEPFSLRMSLGRRPQNLAVLLAAILGAPALGHVLEMVSILAGVELSDSLKMLTEIMQSARGYSLAILALVISVGPGIGEELMFRGFIQTRLVERHGPWLGIGISSLLFGALHLDVIHGLFAALMGVYLGWLSYRFGSIWPGIFAHAFNNLLVTLFTAFLPDPRQSTVMLFTSAAVSSAVFGGSAWLIARRTQPISA